MQLRHFWFLWCLLPRTAKEWSQFPQLCKSWNFKKCVSNNVSWYTWQCGSLDVVFLGCIKGHASIRFSSLFKFLSVTSLWDFPCCSLSSRSYFLFYPNLKRGRVFLFNLLPKKLRKKSKHKICTAEMMYSNESPRLFS